MDYEIKLSKLDDNSLLDILLLLKESYNKSTKFSLDFLKWQYVDNPLGKAISYNAFFHDKIVAHYSVIPIIMNIQGEKIRGILDINTATHPDHRGKKLFTLLANKTFEFAYENGYNFVIGVANAQSTHGYIKNLGFQLIAPLNVKVGCGEICIRDEYEFSRYWDIETLNWRLKNPSTCYYKNNNIIFSKRFFGAKDFLGLVQEDISSSILLPSLNFSPVNLYVGIGADLSNGLYSNLPGFIKISPFNLIFRDLSGKLPHVLKNNILFQLMDFDVA